MDEESTLAKKKKIKIILLTVAMAQMAKRQNEQLKKRPRRWWVKPWVNRQLGNLALETQMLESQDFKTFKNYLRMDETTFNKLLNVIQPKIQKSDTNFRECIPAKNMLIVTIRYLATGESFRSLMYNFRISESSISNFIPVVCKAIYDELKSKYLKVRKYIYI